MPKHKSRRFFDPIHGINFTAIRCAAKDRAKVVAALVPKFPDEGLGERGQLATCSYCDNQVVLWFLPECGAAEIAHEATHAALMVLLQRGYEVTADAHESVAYYVGFVVKSVGNL